MFFIAVLSESSEGTMSDNSESPLRASSATVSHEAFASRDAAEDAARRLYPDGRDRILEAPTLGRAILQLLPDSTPEHVRRDLERDDWLPNGSTR
jgi:hypothetical protein